MGLLVLEDLVGLMEAGGGEKLHVLKENLSLYDIDKCRFITTKDVVSQKSVDECENKFSLNWDGVPSFEEFVIMMK